MGDTMEKQHKVSKAQQKAVNRYIQKNYDRIFVFLSKGRKNEIKAHAEAQGESLNAFIFRAINETMEREKQDTKESKKQNRNKTDKLTLTNTSTIETPETEPNNVSVIPQDLQGLLQENEERVDLERLLSDVMYQFDIQNTFGVDGLTRLLEKARNKNN